MSARHPTTSRQSPNLTTSTLAKSVVSMLSRHNIAVNRGRVIIACSERVPLLVSALIEDGVGRITRWNSIDAQDFPLTLLISNNDVLVDLSGPGGTVDDPGSSIDPFTDRVFDLAEQSSPRRCR
ncbi:hypothetical protein QMK17_21070 [Rhodococcus sp. G-MC3]|uniref:hypothetical protein n=1 Tax=Rhodococcus sp. G-MC3 TaxID=3046209 RepID=UPI0024B8AB14|nr:hypothetical protein [Rhodococcus sp. G-MC3]MDJ0395817.1 hypothetical protein [Rhodococcus sp. G-MC3]